MDKGKRVQAPAFLRELEYVQMLVDGNASIFWHSLPRGNPNAADVPELVKDALYRAVAQTLRERVGLPLPPNRHQFSNVLAAARRTAAEAQAQRPDAANG